MSENIGILSTPDGNGAYIKVSNDSSINLSGVFKDFIRFPSGIIYSNNNEDYKLITITAGTTINNSYSSNACLHLFRSDDINAPGWFELVANDGTNGASLLGKSQNQSLTWYGRTIDTIHSSGTNHIQYTNGLLICFDKLSYPANTTSKTFSFPKTFIEIPSITISTSSINFFYGVNVVTSSNFEITCSGNGNSAIVSIRYIAIGRWK